MTEDSNRGSSEENPSGCNFENIKYMKNEELMREIASMSGNKEYNPSADSETTKYKRFTKGERQQIYEAITGNSGEEFLRNQLPRIIMEEIGSELHSNFRDEFSRKDLKQIYRALSERE